MNLEPFTSENVAQLKSWFLQDDLGNKFIAFYSKPDKWLELTDDTRRFAFAALIKGKMIGFADVELLGENGWGFALGIDPLNRGKGFGKKLVSLVEEFVRSKGAETLFAGVENNNVACKELLEKSGFSKTGDDEAITSYIKIIQS